MPMSKENTQRSLCLLLLLAMVGLTPLLAAPDAPKVGGGSCSMSIVNGTYFYVLGGSLLSNGEAAAYAELGKLVANGSGGVSGQSVASVNGQQTVYSLSGSYSIQANCTGTITLNVNSQFTTTLTFQLVNNAQAVVLAISNSGQVITGRAYRQTAGSVSNQCATGSLSGNYGYLLTGVATSAGSTYAYSDAGQVVADGNGNLSTTSVANLGGGVSPVTAAGNYSVQTDCLGTASIITDQNITENFQFAIAQDGATVLFIETDAGTTVGGTGQPQFAAAQQAVSNGASFASQRLSPGALFSIFGTGLSAETASAQSLPLRSILSSTQVLVNGGPIPLVYVADGQINAQMPIDVPTGEPVSMTVTNGTATSNAVTISVLPAAPGLFTSNGSQAVVQNPNGSVNSSAAPARPGDVLVAYLTGGGAVNSSGPWITGAASPAGPSSVNSPYSLAVGDQAAEVEYVGLTPGFVGLYQANFKVPTIPSGTYPVVLTVGGVPSNAATIVVGQ